MDTEILHTALYVLLAACAVLAAMAIDYKVKFLRQRKKNYFLNRDRERYAETIFASKDGYFAFVYPDDQIKDPLKNVKERCSRRLAVMLNLKKGTDSSFDDVLSMFYKEDSLRLKKYLLLMQEEGIAFEDTFTLKTTKRGVHIFGARINGGDGNLYCDMLWFRDLSKEQIKIEELTAEAAVKDEKIKTLEDLADYISTPVYLKNHTGCLETVNKKYVDLTSAGSKENTLKAKEKTAWQKIADELFEAAVQTNQPQKKDVQVVVGGEAHYFELKETPFHKEGKLDQIGTVGQMIDISDLYEEKRHFKVHQNAHLEILSALKTAFAIFDTKSDLVFYNQSFADMWHLTPEELAQKLSYVSFLNIIYNKRMLPDVTDFKEYRQDEQKLFSNLIEPKEDLLHLPEGKTLRRLVATHPNGVIFAYEDVSDKLQAERTINELLTVCKNILDGMHEAVLIFSPSGQLKYFNAAYTALFEADSVKLQNLPNVREVLDMQKHFFKKTQNWENLEKHIFKFIFETPAPFKLERDDGMILEVTPSVLADENVMVTYLQSTPSDKA